MFKAYPYLKSLSVPCISCSKPIYTLYLVFHVQSLYVQSLVTFMFKAYLMFKVPCISCSKPISKALYFMYESPSVPCISCSKPIRTYVFHVQNFMPYPYLCISMFKAYPYLVFHVQSLSLYLFIPCISCSKPYLKAILLYFMFKAHHVKPCISCSKPIRTLYFMFKAYLYLVFHVQSLSVPCISCSKPICT